MISEYLLVRYICRNTRFRRCRISCKKYLQRSHCHCARSRSRGTRSPPPGQPYGGSQVFRGIIHTRLLPIYLPSRSIRSHFNSSRSTISFLFSILRRSYTMESSFCGCDQGLLAGLHLDTKHLNAIGQDFCQALSMMKDYTENWSIDKQVESMSNLGSNIRKFCGEKFDWKQRGIMINVNMDVKDL